MDTSPTKRPVSSSTPNDDNGPPAKKIKTTPEEPAQYSDAVRKKLASTSRTGQACDRCKERKMKCDSDPVACQPCRQKGLRCYTTDRVTGQARERGETDRTENELQFLRDQVGAYQQRYGPLQRPEQNGIHNAPIVGESMSQPRPVSVSNPTTVPDARYVGWPAPDNSEPIRNGPVKGTVVDIMDGKIDVADWECDMMRDYPADQQNKFNLSRTSIVNTICGFQRVDDPGLPPREEAIRDANSYLIIMAQYIPVVHRQSFMDLVNRLYEHPKTLSIAERVQVIMVFAIVAHQTATRNYLHAAEKFEDSHRYLHYSLSHYRELLNDPSLASMQAMAFIAIHFRNFPKPGVSWAYCHKILVRAIELEYHRDPDKIQLPRDEDSALCKELRKRVFHVILGICVTTGCRVGLPAPWQFQHVDLPLPLPIQDSEISSRGISSQLSGQCDFRPCLHLAKLLPLLTELHNNIVSVRKPAPEYLRMVEALNTKIVAWRQDWDDSIKSDPKHLNLNVATLLLESWAAEFQLNLYHPVCCTSEDPEVIERHLDICHKAAKRLLQAFHTLSRDYKGVDFTWHSTLAYATGFGITLYVYRRRNGPMTAEQFDAMRNELKGWTSLMAYADLVLRMSVKAPPLCHLLTSSTVGTGNHLQRQFQPRVQTLEEECRRSVIPQPPKASNTHVHVSNGASIGPNVKVEQSSATAGLQDFPTQGHQGSTSRSVYMQQQMSSQIPSQSSMPNQQSWSAAYSLLPQPPASTPSTGAGSNLTSPVYPNFSQSAMSPAAAPDAYAPVPTSLASLLNGSGNFYANYPVVPQAQQGVGGPIENVEPAMTFSPNHYYDGPGPLQWPLISLPPGQQS
jgi:hypothetical protein